MEGETNLRRTATLGALASVAIVIGIIVVVWLLFFRDTGSNSGQQANENNQSQQADNGNAQNENPAQSGSGNSGDQNTEGANGSGDAQSGNEGTGKTDQNGKPLPETGPRENALVFLGTALAASGVYYVFVRRKLARQ